MKWEARSNFILACRLHRRELWNLLVKDIRWKDARLYVFVKKILIGDSLAVDERLIPVVPGQEHAILYLSVMRDPNEWMFTGFHIPLHRSLYTLRRHYTQAFYRFLAPDRTVSAPNEQHFTSPNDHDQAAGMEVAKAMGCSHLDFDTSYALTSVGEIHRQYMDTEKKQKLIMEDIREDEKTSELL